MHVQAKCYVSRASEDSGRAKIGARAKKEKERGGGARDLLLFASECGFKGQFGSGRVFHWEQIKSVSGLAPWLDAFFVSLPCSL